MEVSSFVVGFGFNLWVEATPLSPHSHKINPIPVELVLNRQRLASATGSVHASGLPSQSTSSSVKITIEQIQQSFVSLANRWEREILNLSSPVAMTKHGAYREIIELGEPVIPLILRRMQERPHFWFAALLELAKPNKDPVDPEMYGDIDAMTNAWIQWGQESGHIKEASVQNR